MQVLVVILGIVIIVVGFYFARGGVASDPAGGTARGLMTIQGPAWLLVVALGVGLVIFGAVWNFHNAEASASSGPTATTTTVRLATTTLPPTTTTSTSTSTSTTTVPHGCRRVVADPEPPLNVRSGPSSSWNSVATLENGTMISAIENHQGWLRIAAPVTGWVFAENTRCQ